MMQARTGTGPTFSAVQRQELAAIGLAVTQIDSLERSLWVLEHFLQPRPPVEDVRGALDGICQRAAADVADLEALLAGMLPAKVEAAARWAFYLDQDPAADKPAFGEPWHEQAGAVIERELAQAHHRLRAAQKAAGDVKGRRQQQVSPVPVETIHRAMLRSGIEGTHQIVVSYTAGSDFSRIVGICMGAAGGDENRSYERWIKAYKATLGDEGVGDEDDSDGPPLIF